MGDFNVNSEIMLCRFDEIPAISPVRIDAPYPGESHHKHCHKRVCRFGVMDIRRSCGCLQHIAVLVSYYIAFHAFDFLIAVYSFLGTGQRGTRTFAVDSPDCRLGGIRLSWPVPALQDCPQFPKTHTLLPNDGNSNTQSVTWDIQQAATATGSRLHLCIL